MILGASRTPVLPPKFPEEPNVSPGGSGTIIYFTCGDCAVEAGRATQHGGRIYKEKMSIGEHGFIAIIADSEGNTIGLHSMH